MKISYQNNGVTVFESELMCTTCTLIERADHLLLVDPNWLPSEVAFIAQEVERRRGDRELYLLFTHSDYDHIIGYERFRGSAKIIASEALLINDQGDDQLQEIRKFYDQYYLPVPWPITYPREADIRIAKGSEELLIGATRYRFFQAPGHNPDGIITFLPDAGILIAGDYLCAVEFPFIYHSVEAYQNTINCLQDLIERETVSLLITGHGPIATDQTELEERCHRAQWYLSHLVAYGKKGVLFPEEQLWQLYPNYPIIQGKFHLENLELAKRELRE